MIGPFEKALPESNSRESASVLRATYGSFATFALTSSTLLLVGLIGKINGPPALLDRRKRSLNKKDQGMAAKARRIMERTMGVGLPFYATMKLGSDRVVLIILVALAADMTNVEDETTDLISSKGWKRLLIHRRWTLAAMLIQILGDFMGVSSFGASWELTVGYLTLLLSIFFMSPPFPSLKAKASSSVSISAASPSSTPKLLATQRENSSWAKPVLNLHRATSPLLCTTEDINLTLAAGTALGVVSCMTLLISRPGAGALTLVDLGLSCFSVCTAAISYQLVQPHAIRKNRGIGLLLGSMMSLGLTTLFGSETWSNMIYQSIFIGVTFGATKLDTCRYLSTSRAQHHPHSRSHHAAEHETIRNVPSRISQLILDSSRKWPLLHSILVEKDSRRIFYFMWYVLLWKDPIQAANEILA